MHRRTPSSCHEHVRKNISPNQNPKLCLGDRAPLPRKRGEEACIEERERGVLDDGPEVEPLRGNRRRWQVRLSSVGVSETEGDECLPWRRGGGTGGGGCGGKNQAMRLSPPPSRLPPPRSPWWRAEKGNESWTAVINANPFLFRLFCFLFTVLFLFLSYFVCFFFLFIPFSLLLFRENYVLLFF